jgi:hypothetical protein
MAKHERNASKMPPGFFVVTAEDSAAQSTEILALFDDLFNGVQGSPDRNSTMGSKIAEPKQDAFEDVSDWARRAPNRNPLAARGVIEQQPTILEGARALVVKAQAIGAPNADGQTAAEFAQIRALVMNVHGILQGTDVAHLVAAPIEHIHRSLDRIEESVARLVDRRRPGRVEYAGSDLVSMLRDPGRVGARQSNVEATVASPLSQAGPDMTAVVSGLIPRDANASFVAGMEDVLEVYQRPHDPAYPVVCVDETSKQLLAETRVPIAAKPGQTAQLDDDYEHSGTANLFMMFAPLEGWRHVKVTDRHDALDYAQVLKDLSDTHFPNAKKIILVQDDLSTHSPASLYEAFPAAEARRLVERFEWHNAPKDGSWLDMAKSELVALSSQCLDRRIPDKQTLVDQVAAWKDSRDKNNAKAGWHFTTAKARVKLKRLYPQRDRVKGLS